MRYAKMLWGNVRTRGGSAPATIDSTTTNVDNGTTHTHELGEITVSDIVVNGTCLEGKSVYDVFGGGKIASIAVDGQSALIVLPQASWEVGATGFANWDAAIAAQGFTFGGYSDWRLPTRAEMDIISRLNGGSAAFNYYEYTFYWTSEEIDTLNAYQYRTADGIFEGAGYNEATSQLKSTAWLYGLAVRVAACQSTPLPTVISDLQNKTHNSLPGLNEGDYKHLTAAELAKLQGLTVPLQITGITLLSASWTLVSTLYEYDLANANITANHVVDVIPENAGIAIVKAAEILPKTVSSAGSVKLYATNAPSANIGITIILTTATI